MAGLKKLGALAAAAKAAQRYVRENPDKADQYIGKAAEFADKRTKGKYSRQISGASSKARSAALGKNRAVGGDAAPTPTNPVNPEPGNPGSPDPQGRTQPGGW
ncbi:MULTISPECIES: antitoxin [unclassified Knoellia]|uniref:antitoxin n=1 Tax=Knoellia altitudinis TaxID=3404795 RepID=UPI0036068C02